MKEWPFSSKNCSSAPQILSFGTFSDQDRRIKSFNDRLLPSVSFTPTSVAYQNQRTHYSQQDQTTIISSMCQPARGKSFINSFVNNQSLGGSPIMATPVSVFHAPNLTVETSDVRSSFKRIGSPSSQLTIFYAGAVSVYKDISPEKAHAIMLLARDEPQDKPVPMPKPQKPVHHPFSVTDHSKSGSGTTGLRVTKTVTSLASTHTDASNMASPVGLRQTRKASLARFLEKRKERVINLSPYYVDNKSSIDRRTPMSLCVSSPPAHHQH